MCDSYAKSFRINFSIAEKIQTASVSSVKKINDTKAKVPKANSGMEHGEYN